MPLRRLVGVTLSCALFFGGGAGCDVGHSNLFQASGGSPPGATTGGGGGGGSGSGGSASTAPGGPCSSSTDCNDQVCDPSGRCVDCSDDKDCLVNQFCSEQHCVATGGETGGTSSGGSGGGGGAPGNAACGDAQVLFVVQRSGTMFEQPKADANYWSMVRDGIAGTDGALSGYDSKLKSGALFFVRVQDSDQCPVTSSAAPQVGAMLPLTDLFTSNASAYQALADDDAKMDAPVPEAVAAGAMLLSGANRHLVLITSGGPDTCDETDDPCLVDPSIKAVQDAQKMGITVHVIGLGDSDYLDTANDENGYQTYLAQLANAGAGEQVKQSSLNEKCGDGSKAEYAQQSGDAHAYRAESAGDVKTAVTEILKSICP